MNSRPSRFEILRRIGPGLITACVVIGPGSILTSSKIGAAHGYQLVWVLGVAAVLMMVYMTMGARLGMVADASPGEILTRHVGRWLAALIGISVFSIASCYQFGNSLGVYAAFSQFIPDNTSGGRTANLALLLLLNGLAITFMFAFKDLYRWLERIMMVFVGLMLFAFLVNLMFAKPDPVQLVSGLIPSLPQGDDGKAVDWIPVLGWIGTTFITAIAYYQAYLVRQKGWSREQVRLGLIDARIGSVLLALITLMIMTTSAAVLRGQDIKNVGEVAQLLKPLFGMKGQVIFCLGLFCAAYSSFLVNSIVGGYLLSDGFNLGVKRDDKWPRILASAVLLIGMVVAILSVVFEINTVPAIVFAQAVTVIAAPLIGGVLWWLTSNEKVMGENRNGWITHLFAGFGFLMLLVLSGYLVFVKIAPRIDEIFS